MPRALCLSFVIVAAFQIPAAAAPVDDIPIPSSVVSLADRLGIDLADRAYFISEMARLLYPNADSRPPVFPAIENDRAATVPMPMAAAVWSRSVFRRTVPESQLATTILADRRATLLARGLSGLDDETLTYVVDHPLLVTFLYERAAAPFAAFAGALRIRQGRVAPPGGEHAVPLWEAAMHSSVSAPDSFIRILFGEFEGRFAYLYETVDAAPPAAAAFALGLWLPDETQRTQRFRALALACLGGYDEWRPASHPFARPLGDLAMLLLRIRTDEAGTPRGPSSRTFWAAAFDVDANVSGSLEAPLPGGVEGPVDAAWLVSATAGFDMYSRTERLDQFAFGQRVFEGAPQPVQAVEVVRGFRRYRMLLVALERMGIRSPATYLTALQRAGAVANVNSYRRFWVLGQFQGALALIARMRAADTINAVVSDSLVTTLSAVPLQGDEYDGGVAYWLLSQLAKALPANGSWEERVIAAMAGPFDAASEPRVLWEGQNYRVALPQAERERLGIVRRKQGGPSLDLAIAIDGLARALRSPILTVERVQQIAGDGKAIAEESGASLRHPAVNLMPVGVEAPRDGLEWLSTAMADLSRITKPADIRRAARIGASLNQLADIILGNTLVSFAYAADIGDPDGAALLAGNVALRHDFGLGRRDGETRLRMPWLPPRQDFQPGVPWHVTGSLLGLDVAMAPMNLRRMSLDHLADAPKLSSIEREAFAVGVNLLEPQRFTDADRDAIAEAIGRGRVRIGRVVSGAEPLGPIAELLGFDGWRNRAIAWRLASKPESVVEEFSLGELLILGGPSGAVDLDAWGTSAIFMSGCTCIRMPSARAWRMAEGRPQFAMMAATMGDLNLAVAVMLRDLNLPAVLAKSILAVAMQDFLDDLSLNSRGWWSLSHEARALKRARVEDYVAVAAAVNGPLVPEESVSHNP